MPLVAPPSSTIVAFLSAMVSPLFYCYLYCEILSNIITFYNGKNKD